MMHTTSAFSMWCWLQLSAIRFVAIYKPIVYRVTWRGPRRTLLALAAICVVFEAWILHIATYDASALSCYDQQTLVVPLAALHLSEIIWSYAVPVVLIAAFDFIVLCRNHSSSQLILEFTGKRTESKHPRDALETVGTKNKSEEDLLDRQRFTAARNYFVFA
jgi:hypothetical protein